MTKIRGCIVVGRAIERGSVIDTEMWIQPSVMEICSL